MISTRRWKFNSGQPIPPKQRGKPGANKINFHGVESNRGNASISQLGEVMLERVVHSLRNPVTYVTKSGKTFTVVPIAELRAKQIRDLPKTVLDAAIVEISEALQRPNMHPGDRAHLEAIMENLALEYKRREAAQDRK